MFNPLRRSLACGTLFTALCTPFAAVAADAYPSRPVELVVPYAPGGASDNIARSLAPVLQKELGATIVVLNRPGANSAIAGTTLARGRNDGYSLMLADVALLLNSAVRSVPPEYDVEKDFTHISLIGSAPLVLFGSASGSKDLAEFLAKAKQKGVNVANAGSGSLGHLAAEMLRLRAAATIVSVPYKGSGLAINDTIAGQVDATFTSTASGNPHVRNGRLRALAIAAPARSEENPEIATFEQLGIKGVNVLNWWGVIGPAGMPADVVDKVARALNAAMQTPEMRQRFATLGITPSIRPTREFCALIKSDLEQWRSVAGEAGIKVD